MTSPMVNKKEITLKAGIPVYLMHNDKCFRVAEVTKPDTYTIDETHTTISGRTYHIKRYRTTRTYGGITYDGWAIWEYDLPK